MSYFKGITPMNNINFAYLLTSGTFKFADPLLLESFQLSKTEFVPARLLSKLYPEDLLTINDAYHRLLNNEFSGVVKFKLGEPDALRWFSVTPFLADTAEGQTIFGNFYEITAEVDNFNAIAKYTNKKNSILHMLAHDLRGPLNIAKSLVKSLERDTNSPEVLEKSQYVSGIIQQSIELISDLISREFLDTLEASLVKKRIDLVLKVNEYLEECRFSAQMARRTFHFHSQEAELFADLDEAKFMQVLNNLMSNALKFTRSGGNIWVGLERRGEFCRMTFRDDGIGIPAHLLPQVFDKFTNARRTGLEGEPTVGLGLSIVKTIVDWHQGRIWCESIEQEGTTFFIELPRIALNPTV
jgi:two-component system sensor histidine kinase VicK